MAFAVVALLVGLGAAAVVAVAVARSRGPTTPVRAVPAATAEALVAGALLDAAPGGYDISPPSTRANGPLDLAAAAALEADPAAATRALQQTGFQGGYARTWTHQSAPGVIVAVGYQFSSPGGAHRYYDTYVRAERNRTATTEFVPGLPAAGGFTDASDAALVLQSVVIWRGSRVYVVGIGDPLASATTAQAIDLARTQARSA